MYWIIKHKPTGLYYGVRRIFVSFCGLAHRFSSVRRARSFMISNGLDSSEYLIINIIPEECEEKIQVGALQLTDRLFSEIHSGSME